MNGWVYNEGGNHQLPRYIIASNKVLKLKDSS